MIPFGHLAGTIKAGLLSQAEADRLNQAIGMLDALVGSLTTAVSAPLSVQRLGDRFKLRLDLSLPFDAEITGGSNPYTWREIYATATGGWAELVGGRTGTDNAWETADNAAVAAGTRVTMRQGHTAPGVQDFNFTVGADGGGGGPPTCELAGLRTTDCLQATGPENAVELVWNGTDRWVSTDPLAYPGGTGVVEFWYTAGLVHLSVGGTELLGCGDGCFTGGALTGHPVTGGGAEPCTGATFRVCVACVPCGRDLVYPPCEPLQTEGAPRTLWANIRQPTYGSVGCVPPVIRLEYDDAKQRWVGSGTAEGGGGTKVCLVLGCCPSFPPGTLGLQFWCEGEPGLPAECNDLPLFWCNAGITLESVSPFRATSAHQFRVAYCASDYAPVPEFEDGGLTFEIVEDEPAPRDPILCPCCSDGESLPLTLFATIEAVDPECNCLHGVVLELQWDPVGRAWISGHTPTPCGGTAQLSIQCWVEQQTPKPWSIQFACNSTGSPVGFWPGSGFASGPMPCQPLALNIIQVAANPGASICCVGRVRFHITE